MRIRSATAALVLAAAATSPALAEPPASPSVVAFAPYGWAPDEARQLRQQLRAAAESSKLIGLVDEEAEAAAFDGRPPPDPTADVRAARVRLDRAARQMTAFQIADAKRNVQEALLWLQRHLGRSEARDEDLRRLYLAVSIAHAERDEAAVAEHLQAFVQRFWTLPAARTPWPPDIRDQLETLRRATGKRTLVIESVVPGQAAIDGLSVGPTPAELEVPVGRHRIEVSAPGAFTRQTWINVPRGATKARVTMHPQSKLARVLSASERLTPALRGQVLRAARRYGITAVYIAGKAPGDRVRLERLGQDAAGPIVVDRRPSDLRVGLVQLWPSPEAPRGGPGLWPLLTAGAGAVAVGVGAALSVSAQRTQDDFRARQHLLTQAQAYALRDRGEQDATAGAVLIGVGLAVIVGGVTWAIFDWAGDEAE